MALDWVQAMLKKKSGFAPFPATLNVRPKCRRMPGFGKPCRRISRDTAAALG